MKILAIHLPAFHREKFNDQAWGKGFTEWDNVKKGKPFFKQHYQPIVPLNKNYYDLSNKKNIEWQIDLAKKYNISGFIFYHYWFGNDNVALEKPAEIFKNEIKKDFEYCFCWANHTWANTWNGKESEVIVAQVYGKEKEWLKHINYLIPFFKDKRYIKINDRPVLYIYNMSDIIDSKEMFEYFNKILKENGMNELYIIEYISSKNVKVNYDKTEAIVEFEPLYTTYFDLNKAAFLKRAICKMFKIIDYQRYDTIWRKIINRKRTYGNCHIQKGCFVNWDNSARKGKNSMIVRGGNPQKFKNYLQQLIDNKRMGSSNDFIIINAWNEWSEGAMLEPCEKYKYGYLEAIKEVSEKSSNTN